MTKPVVFDNGGRTMDRYLVVMPNGDTYYLSPNCNMPNEVCMYAGHAVHDHKAEDVDDFVDQCRDDPKWRGREFKTHKRLPDAVQRFIQDRLNEPDDD